MTNPYGDFQPGPPPHQGQAQPHDPGQYTQQLPAQPQYAQQPHHLHDPGQAYPVQQQAPYQPAGQPHPYGQAPPAGYPAAYPGPPAPPPRPITIWIASVVVWILTGAGVVGGILLIAMQDGFISGFTTISDTGSLYQAGLSAMLTFLGAIVLAYSAVLLLFSFFAFRGANWGRWVVAIWLILSLVTSVTNLLGSEFFLFGASMVVDLGILLVLNLLGIALYGGLLALYLVPASHRWYQQQPRSRR